MAGQIGLDDILSYFKEVDWPVDEVDREGGRIYASVRGRNVLLDLEVGLNQEWQLLQITLTLPELVPSHRLPEALALINRLNYNLPLGHFEIGLESRQLSFYTALPINELPYIRAQFEALLAWGIDIADEEHPRLMQVLYSNTPPEEATTAGERQHQRRFDA